MSQDGSIVKPFKNFVMGNKNEKYGTMKVLAR